MKISKIYQTSASIVFIGFILWFAKPVLIPLAYAFFIAILLYPLTKFFEKKRFGKTLSVALPILFVFLFFIGIVAILRYEIVVLSEKWTLIEQQMDFFLNNIQKQLENHFGWTSEKQWIWLRDNPNFLTQNAGKYLGETLSVIFAGVFHLVIIPVYVALLLHFRTRLMRFLLDITPQPFKEKMPLVVQDTVKLFSKFIRGMVLVYLSVGILNSLGLWAIGVDNPILYGMATAIMTIVPYFGIIISALLPITITWLETESVWLPLGIVAIFAIVQYLEESVIYPFIVGKFVNINTLAVLIAIFVGALIWGVSGMILFVPFLAVFRLFLERFPELNPWSKMLGND